VKLPEWKEGCDADVKKVACAYPDYDLRKLMSTSSRVGSPAVEVIKSFAWTNDQQNEVAVMIAGEGKKPEEAAKTWVEANATPSRSGCRARPPESDAGEGRVVRVPRPRGVSGRASVPRYPGDHERRRPPLFAFDNSYVRELEGLYVPWQAAHASAPTLLALNEELAVELGADPAALREPAGVDVLVGNTVPAGASPVALAYAGHQFGGYSPRLGDGRALLLGEVVDVHGRRRDLHLKGSGRTPFARGGDGKAAVGPMLREHLIGEAMHALGIPTTRSLAVVATGDPVRRETVLPGASSSAWPPAMSASGRSSTPPRRATSSSCAAWPTTRSRDITRTRSRPTTATWPSSRPWSTRRRH
jgi:hypothetical protein